MSYLIEYEKYARLTKQQAINVGQWVYYDSKYKCRKRQHKYWRTVTGGGECWKCRKVRNKDRKRRLLYGKKDAARQKVDDALFEKKIQNMIDQDYLD